MPAESMFREDFSHSVVFKMTQRDILCPLLLTLFFLAVSGGCAFHTTELAQLTDQPLNERFQLGSVRGPQHSERTRQTLRILNLDTQKGKSVQSLVALLDEIQREPTADLISSFVELAYIEGTRQEKTDPALAAEIYTVAAMEAYHWLFDTRWEKDRNPYDSRFQDIHLLYNGSVERLLRLILNDKKRLYLQPGNNFYVQNQESRWEVYCELVTGTWKPEEIDYFTFASDIETVGIENKYCQGGLGVPLIARRKKGNLPRTEERYYPADIHFPVTAFLRPCPGRQLADGTTVEVVLELYDPLVSASMLVDGQEVPLQTDLTTPLACFLSRPDNHFLPTLGLLRPDELLKPIKDGNNTPIRSAMGLYLMEPYDPDKIPVVMIHGLWSSPMTWMEMYNSLRKDEELQSNYQFWFYFYPSGQPFWVSAAQLRNDLKELRKTLDPDNQAKKLDEMVLIGHSMGGLISKMQVLGSGESFWRYVSDTPVDELVMKAGQKKELRDWFYFEPNPSVRRIITIATPFRGSKAANHFTKWFARRLIDIPQRVTEIASAFFSGYTEKNHENSLLYTKTSVDSLSPDCPAFLAMEECYMPRNVVWNNIVGVLPELEKSPVAATRSDGVVNYTSAHRIDVESEKKIPSPHMEIHLQPATIGETSRILKEHLYQMEIENKTFL